MDFNEWFDLFRDKCRSMGYHGPIDKMSFHDCWEDDESMESVAKAFLNEMGTPPEDSPANPSINLNDIENAPKMFRGEEIKEAVFSTEKIRIRSLRLDREYNATPGTINGHAVYHVDTPPNGSIIFEAEDVEIIGATSDESPSGPMDPALHHVQRTNP